MQKRCVSRPLARIAVMAAFLAGCGSESPPQGGTNAGPMLGPAEGGSAGSTGGGAVVTDAGSELAPVDDPSEASHEAGTDEAVSFDGTGSADDDATVDASAACSPFVTNVVSVSYGPGAGFGQNAFPRVVEGPPSGGGCCKGSLSVLSLGEGGSIVVELGENIVDGPGPDFIVFENPFDIGGDPKNPYADPGTVEVSADGVAWFGFPCTASAYPYGLCAGWHPVFTNPGSNTIDPLDPAVAGGDPFDLADLPGDAGISEVRYVRITDRPDIPGDFDLDAVAAVHGRCR